MHENFKSILNVYKNLFDINQGGEALSSDAQINNNEKELDVRNQLYSTLLSKYVESYTDNQKKKNDKKWFFYKLIVGVFFCLIGVAILMSIIVTIFYKDNAVAVLVTYFSSFVGLLSALITIPNTIAKYLFNPKEDEIITKIVMEMQKQDNVNREINQKALNHMEGKYNPRKVYSAKAKKKNKRKVFCVGK